MSKSTPIGTYSNLGFNGNLLYQVEARQVEVGVDLGIFQLNTSTAVPFAPALEWNKLPNDNAMWRQVRSPGISAVHNPTPTTNLRNSISEVCLKLTNIGEFRKFYSIARIQIWGMLKLVERRDTRVSNSCLSP